MIAVYEPLGIIFWIKPFNFLALVPFLFIPAMLLAGNKIFLKPAEGVAQASLKLAELIK